jgi:hypothetical protein
VATLYTSDLSALGIEPLRTSVGPKGNPWDGSCSWKMSVPLQVSHVNVGSGGHNKQLETKLYYWHLLEAIGRSVMLLISRIF